MAWESPPSASGADRLTAGRGLACPPGHWRGPADPVQGERSAGMWWDGTLELQAYTGGELVALHVIQ